MATLYFAQDEEDRLVACATANDAKAIARGGYETMGVPRHVYKVELNKDMGTRELMCALFNAVDESYVGSKEVVFTAGPRKRRSAGEVEEPAAEVEADPENPYDI